MTTLRKTSFPGIYTSGAVLLVFFAFAMSAVLSRAVFERLPHLEDEVAYLYQAKIFARFQAVAPIPEPRRAYWQPFVVDYSTSGNRFGKYTPGWSALLSAGVNLGQPWVINALLAGLTVALVYRLCLEIFNRDAGLIAAALTAFSPMALLLNATLMGHTAAVFYVVLFLYAYWRIERGRRAVVWGIVAGIALGLLAITRPLPALALAVPFVVWSGVRVLKVLSSQLSVLGSPFTRQIVGAQHAAPVPESTPEFKVEHGSENNQRAQYIAPLQVSSQNSLRFVLTPLILLSVFTILIALATPAFNAAATGNPRQNLYELVWSYDKVGFGECCGRSGHTLEKGIRQTRFDLSLAASDLFGWSTGGEPILGFPERLLRCALDDVVCLKAQFIAPEIEQHYLLESGYYPNKGLSFLLLPFGLLAGMLWRVRGTKHSAKGRQDFRLDKAQRQHFGLLLFWSAVAAVWLVWTVNLPQAQLQNPQFAWIWIGASLAWILMPVVLFLHDASPQARYTWLLWSVLLCVLLFQVTYWIGSQRYSTRYYDEALISAAILSALPLAWLAQKVSRPLVYFLLVPALCYSLFSYSLPRTAVLKGFNFVTQDVIREVNERRGDTPALVIVNGPGSGDDTVRWRAMGALMAMTSPFLDSEIVVAWDYGSAGVREQIVNRFPGRHIIEMDATGNDAHFRD